MDLKAIQKKRLLIRALKIAIGSAAAIMIAELLQLKYATSAGSVALLTIVTTKWETVRLAYSRILSFLITIFYAYLIYNIFGLQWEFYGIFLFLVATTLFFVGWESSLSVNALIGIQILAEADFSIGFILNEFTIVLIGISLAIVINLISDYRSQRTVIINDMRKVENDMQDAMTEISDFLRDETKEKTTAWSQLIEIENYLEGAVERAWTYQNDTFVSHPEYYINYFEMRTKQTNVLHNLHYQIKILKKYPTEAELTADMLDYIKLNITELNDPEEQILVVREASDLLIHSTNKTAIFEGKAVLYHIFLNLEEFLVFKKRFNNSLGDVHKRIYQNQVSVKKVPKYKDIIF